MSRDLGTLPQWARVELLQLRRQVEDFQRGMPFEGRALRMITTHGEFCAPNPAGYCSCPDSPAADNPDEAELVCSDVPGSGSVLRHKPVIDLDMPCHLVSSATPGHFHLYIDRLVDHGAYMNMLDAMAKAGVVETGYSESSRRRGYSAVRHPDRLAKQ